MAHHGQKAKAVPPYRRVIVIHDNAVEETVDRSPQPAKRLHRGKERLAILEIEAKRLDAQKKSPL